MRPSWLYAKYNSACIVDGQPRLNADVMFPRAGVSKSADPMESPMLFMLCFCSAMIFAIDDGRSEDVAELMWQLDSVMHHRWNVNFDSESDCIVATSDEEVPEEPQLNELGRPGVVTNRNRRSMVFRIGLAVPQTDEIKAEYKRICDELNQLRKSAPVHVQFHLGFSKSGMKQLSRDDFKTLVRHSELQTKVRRLCPPSYAFRSLLLLAPVEPGGADDRSEEVKILQSDILEVYTLLERLKN